MIHPGHVSGGLQKKHGVNLGLIHPVHSLPCQKPSSLWFAWGCYIIKPAAIHVAIATKMRKDAEFLTLGPRPLNSTKPSECVGNLTKNLAKTNQST